MKSIILIVISTLLINVSFGQANLEIGKWRVAIHRVDGNEIIFNLDIKIEENAPVIYIQNGAEEMKINDLNLSEDSIFFQMPVFESGFKGRIISVDSIEGVWQRASSGGRSIILPFTATARYPQRFPLLYGNAKVNVTGKWALSFHEANGDTSPAIGNFTQNGNELTGSVLTPSGDDRYLQGTVSGDSLWLSGFDGIHSLLYKAKIQNNKLQGSLFSGATSKEEYTGEKKKNPTLPNSSAMYLKKGESGKLSFSFKDMDGNIVSINDPRFKNKVVILDIMGSWCPNCMDETAFLSDYYNKNKDRGVEVIGLAYELSTDFDRSRNSLLKFQKEFDVKYPILITPVSVSDKQRTEKTLPEFTPIKMFPTTIILDRSGKVYKIDTGFQGPGTGEYYTQYVQEFNQLMDKLIKQKIH